MWADSPQRVVTFFGRCMSGDVIRYNIHFPLKHKLGIREKKHMGIEKRCVETKCSVHHRASHKAVWAYLNITKGWYRVVWFSLNYKLHTKIRCKIQTPLLSSALFHSLISFLCCCHSLTPLLLSSFIFCYPLCLLHLFTLPPCISLSLPFRAGFVSFLNEAMVEIIFCWNIDDCETLLEHVYMRYMHTPHTDANIDTKGLHVADVSWPISLRVSFIF